VRLAETHQLIATLFSLLIFKIKEAAEASAFSKSLNSKISKSLQRNGLYFIPFILADRSIFTWFSINNF